MKFSNIRSPSSVLNGGSLNMKSSDLPASSAAPRARRNTVLHNVQPVRQPLSVAASDNERSVAPFVAGGMALVATAFLSASSPALADLNMYEANQNGEFNIGTAKQFGGVTLDKESFEGQDLRRSNFTAASMRKTNLNNTNLRGAYLIKAVCAGASFEGANLQDVLFDRAVLVEANLKNADMSRAVFTLTDFRDADIEGADFTDALIDKPQQMAMCKYASGKNPSTGVSTRASLGCGGGRRGTPSAYQSDESARRPDMKEFDPEEFNAGSQRRATGASAPR